MDVPAKRAAPDSFPVMPDDLKIDIAHVVRRFRFTGVDAVTCLARAAIGHAVLHACGLPARLIPYGRRGRRTPTIGPKSASNSLVRGFRCGQSPQVKLMSLPSISS